ncbi:class I SAM-dependent methyltransferase [Micromonospora avicenniae]|uniref:Methyltransferase domain-containing protein n=1 Tax=Micromonospora avicenniae TaxID=1198245 RepID=A0A1N6S098_9ACTN|nr:class I SAM-dependent methyltransferase [Micromonospora avicenniae]SIQ34543.1 Methyltransferase domain-containing protein [Micromonospora avicenniae]
MSESSAAEKGYIHGYATTEQQRLIRQAELWKDRLILDGTVLAGGTRLLEVGCGAGAVLRILGESFPDVHLGGVDISPAQIEFARDHLAAHGVRADLDVADARSLPYETASFDHVWMMWVLEHMSEDDAKAALREARRVLAPGGRITVIETDYATIKVGPSSPAVTSVLSAVVGAMRAFGQSDAGTQLWGWLDEVGFSDIDPGERLLTFRGAEMTAMAHYFADAVEATIDNPALSSAEEAILRQGVRELREPGPGSWLRGVVHKAQASAGSRD